MAASLFLLRNRFPRSSYESITGSYCSQNYCLLLYFFLMSYSFDVSNLLQLVFGLSRCFVFPFCFLLSSAAINLDLFVFHCFCEFLYRSNICCHFLSLNVEMRGGNPNNFSSSTVESRHRLSVSIEDAYKRGFQRNKARNTEKLSCSPVQDKNQKCKLSVLKLFLLIAVTGTFFLLVYPPEIYHDKQVSQHCNQPSFVNRWIWGKEELGYNSQESINWEDLLKVIDKESKGNEYQRIGLLNFDPNEIHSWNHLLPNANHIVLHLDTASRNITWNSLYPEWIDEEQLDELPTCPSLPKINVPQQRLDLIAVKLPCKSGMNWSRDIPRLHLQLATAALAASAKGLYPVNLLFISRCFPIPNLFTCKELARREGNIWLYKPDLNLLRKKVQLPSGSCELAVPLMVEEGANSGNERREAYATILHSADVYVCGAIAAAQSIRMSGSTRDLVILVDETISELHRSGLAEAGWKIRTIKRIRNPKAEKDSYNEWNYSKFRLWQLTEYSKLIFIDADLLILRNIDFLFGFPEISAAGNNASLFNSGVMVIEPSACTFRLLMDHIRDFESYNGGDQGYLNEVFTWWHRIPKHMNFLKHFWVGDEEEKKTAKTRLFSAEPPVLYVLHYLGLKPWLCFRDYDCNWNEEFLQEFASDAAHEKWWRVHDAMPERLQRFCLLRSKQKAALEWDRRGAERANYSDGHWRIKIRDGRLNTCVDKFCYWESMLWHWGEANWTDNNSSSVPPPAGTTTASLKKL